MLCTTIKKGQECPFMTKKGCSYNGGACFTLVEQCTGCTRVMELESGWYCTACPEPAIKWKNGNCNLATHVARETKEGVKINPLKASKRGGH
ncbi:PxxKW family cysteine-rich protein [Desulfatibacillum aliphaticivorans]|uniref:PxxKW family cysteine-rich protein n=1 Tax=Desulfatibacillum aliphaticivorans TaxID=218208 RepID=UPI000412235E|nr:PxxKW family cysteine-rich protein [Desulfatibacillum aliphaticivorans]